MKLLSSPLGRLRIIGFLEGLSFLLLVGIAMPLKYYGGYPHATQDVGMAHGVLFVAYIVASLPAIIDCKWSFKTSSLVLVASLIPLGTFIAEYKIFRHDN
ncbi:MAG: DUF3817 domain-containing protein [Reichenbachiella sp.]